MCYAHTPGGEDNGGGDAEDEGPLEPRVEAKLDFVLAQAQSFHRMG